MRTRTTKTILVDNIPTEVTIEIDTKEDKLIQHTLETERLKHQGYQGIYKPKPFIEYGFKRKDIHNPIVTRG